MKIPSMTMSPLMSHEKQTVEGERMVPNRGLRVEARWEMKHLQRKGKSPKDCLPSKRPLEGADKAIQLDATQRKEMKGRAMDRSVTCFETHHPFLKWSPRMLAQVEARPSHLPWECPCHHLQHHRVPPLPMEEAGRPTPARRKQWQQQS